MIDLTVRSQGLRGQRPPWGLGGNAPEGKRKWGLPMKGSMQKMHLGVRLVKTQSHWSSGGQNSGDAEVKSASDAKVKSAFKRK